MRWEIENSLLRPTVHDPRYDELIIEEEEDEREDAMFDKCAIVTDGEQRYKVLDMYWDSWCDMWLYECQPLGDSEWWYIEIHEDKLSAA